MMSCLQHTKIASLFLVLFVINRTLQDMNCSNYDMAARKSMVQP